MRLYQVHLINDEGHSAGYRYFTSRREAQSHARHWTKDPSVEHVAHVTAIDVTSTRAGIVSALNRFGNHADNG